MAVLELVRSAICEPFSNSAGGLAAKQTSSAASYQTNRRQSILETPTVQCTNETKVARSEKDFDEEPVHLRKRVRSPGQEGEGRVEPCNF